MNANSDGVAAGRCPFQSGSPARFPMTRTRPLDPPPAYGEMREIAPISRVELWDGREAWFVTSYDLVRQLLSDPRVSADSTRPGYPSQNAAMKVVTERYRTFVVMDPPAHTKQRRLLTSEFTVRKIESMRPTIDALASHLFDQMMAKSRPVDFVASVALPLPSLVICNMLGVPYGDHDFFQQKSALMSSNQSTAQEASAAADALCDGYIVDLVRRKDLVPTDDLLSRLVVKYLRTGEATEHDLVAWARLILVAGHITSANTMALGLLALMENLEQFAALIAEPALLPNAVEEILRYVDVAHNGRRRTALEDIEVAGVTIAAGNSIILHNSTANRDGRIFEDPDSFNIRREHAQHHVAFGYGVHQCLGQHLARAEIRSVLELVVSRIPGVKLAVPLETLDFAHHQNVYGVNCLPVTW